MIGEDLDGRYRVLAPLGEGAMGEVFLVEHLGLGRKEALKVLRHTLGDDPTLVARFRREARATNRLQHPNIIAIHDFGRLPDGRFYITTEYVAGQPLDHVLHRSGGLDIGRALRILSQLASAIGHAHSRGVIHRDLKPANIILCQGRSGGDVIKVLDFGVAKIISRDPRENSSLHDTGGRVFGTPDYIAPEQIRGNGEEPRIDIYAFGCLAFALLTGAPPFAGHPLEVLNSHLEVPAPRLKHRRQDVPQKLDDLIAKCLSKSPGARPASGDELLAIINGLIAGAAALVALRAPPPSAKLGFGGSPPADAPTRPRFAGGGYEETAVEITTTAAQSTIPYVPAMGLITPERTAIAREVEELAYQLAEELLDHGCSDIPLIVTLANLTGAQGGLESVTTRVAELESAHSSVSRRGQEVQSRLRFAVGELRFEIEAARSRGESTDASADQLRQLESRMAELAETCARELSAIDDRAITLAADLAHHEDEVAGLFAELIDQVQPLAAELAHISAIADLAARLAEARAAL